MLAHQRLFQMGRRLGDARRGEDAVRGENALLFGRHAEPPRTGELPSFVNWKSPSTDMSKEETNPGAGWTLTAWRQGPRKPAHES